MKYLKNTFKAFYKKFRFNLSASNNLFFIGFYKYLYRPKPNSLSKLISDYSKQKAGNFTVIQIGANDGITNDPIHKFIKRDNWKGVLLEPQKDVFDTYLKKIYAKNKGIVCLNAALGETDSFNTLYKIGFSNARWATGLASFNKDVLIKAFTEGSVKINTDKEGISIPENEDERIVSEKVQMICFRTIIEKYNIQSVDLLQIDTEGFDFEVIKMFDFTRIRPKMIVFEETHIPPATLIKCYDFLHDRGYKTQKFDANVAALDTL